MSTLPHTICYEFSSHLISYDTCSMTPHVMCNCVLDKIFDLLLLFLPLTHSTVAIALYLLFLYFKHKHNKTGSYNVHERHVSRSKLRPPEPHTAESGTSSVHSSFRDITAQYHRERVLGGVAELGCAGELRRPSDLSSCGGDSVLNGVNRAEGSTDGSETSTCGLVTVSIHGSGQLREQI